MQYNTTYNVRVAAMLGAFWPGMRHHHACIFELLEGASGIYGVAVDADEKHPWPAKGDEAIGRLLHAARGKKQLAVAYRLPNQQTRCERETVLLRLLKAFYRALGGIHKHNSVVFGSAGSIRTMILL